MAAHNPDPHDAAPGVASAAGNLSIAVIGNPNAGKTTIFNRLTGMTQRVGNYPGVTVEKKEGSLRFSRSDAEARGVADPGGERDLHVRIIDLPGTYSLAAHSPDEMVAVDVLLGQQEGEERPSLVLSVVDASNLQRNLYLVSQLLDLGVQVVIALNMTDIARKRGRAVDHEKLSANLGVPVIPVEGHRGIGIDRLREALALALREPASYGAVPGAAPASSNSFGSGGSVVLPDALVNALNSLRSGLEPLLRHSGSGTIHPFEISRALVDVGGYSETRLVERFGPDAHRALSEARGLLEEESMRPAAMEARARYRWIHERTRGCQAQPEIVRRSRSERADKLLTHRILGPAIFILLMTLVFQSIFSWAGPVMDFTDGVFGSLGRVVGAWMPEGVLRSLVVDGVIAGAGGVVIFLPQILILFLFIGLLEDCGYMARAAFLMDRVMAKCGLSGKSFIPMLSGFACAIPGVMAARVIENRRDRLATILVTPLMSCSARLPVYAILIATFIPDMPVVGSFLGMQALTLIGLYLLGVVTAIAMAWLLKKTILRGSAPPFVLELPCYKWPSLQTVLLRLYERAKSFLLRAGTIILAITILVWALAYFPRSPEVASEFEARRDQIGAQLEAATEGSPEAMSLAARLGKLDREEAGAYLRQSYLGTMGQAAAPVFYPLGWDWKISMAVIASFPAREIIIATLSTIYNLGDQEDETSEKLQDRLEGATWHESGEPVFNIPVALSIMVFFALCCQCGATLATIRRETNSWFWAAFTFVYMTALAYVAALLIYQLGMRFT